MGGELFAIIQARSRGKRSRGHFESWYRDDGANGKGE